jgi:hypothetical protein
MLISLQLLQPHKWITDDAYERAVRGYAAEPGSQGALEIRRAMHPILSTSDSTTFTKRVVQTGDLFQAALEVHVYAHHLVSSTPSSGARALRSCHGCENKVRGHVHSYLLS